MKSKKVMVLAVVLSGIILALLIVFMNKTSIISNSLGNLDLQKGDSDSLKGPHGGRLLSKDDFQLEITIYEQNVPPQFRVYAYEKGKAVNPDEVKLTLELHRLGGQVDVFGFKEERDYLLGDKVVEEPHSFDVKVVAERSGQTYRWNYSQIEGRVELTPEAIKTSGIVVERVRPARIKTIIELPGEIRLNTDKLARIVPRVSGVVTEVHKNLGDTVKKGEIIAVLNSRELADLKSEYLASIKRVELARSNFKREHDLWKKKISAEQDYLTSRQVLAEREINLKAITQKLLALGLAKEDLDNLPKAADVVLARYELRAPFEGVVIEKSVAVGESIKEDADIFVIADLTTVWVDITVYPEDLNAVKVGQEVTVKSEILSAESSGILTYLGPMVGVETRSAKGRIVIPNPRGIWRPGLFVTVQVVQEEVTIPLAIKAEALQTFRDWDVVFINVGNFFEVRPVKLGRHDGEWVEVLSGLSLGEKYASKNSFILKADVEKAGATHEH